MSKIAKIFVGLFGCFMVVGGVYCLFSPTQTYLVMGFVVGISMICDAAGRMTAWWQFRRTADSDIWMLIGAIISAVLGFFLVNSAYLQLGVDAFIVYYVAFWLVALGFTAIIRAHKIHRFHKEWDTKTLGTHWYLPLILGILMIAFGVLCMFKPLVMASTIGIFMGLGIVSSGVNLITLAFTSEDRA